MIHHMRGKKQDKMKIKKKDPEQKKKKAGVAGEDKSGKCELEDKCINISIRREDAK